MKKTQIPSHLPRTLTHGPELPLSTFPSLHVYCQPREGYRVIGLKSYTVLLHSNVLFCTTELSLSGASVNRAIVWSALPKGFTPISPQWFVASLLLASLSTAAVKCITGLGARKWLYMFKGGVSDHCRRGVVLFFLSIIIVKWLKLFFLFLLND